jgi:hypothetical protein
MKRQPYKPPRGVETLHASMIEVAREEIKAWKPSLGPGVPMIVLFAFIHRFVTGKSICESFGSKREEIDYQI